MPTIELEAITIIEVSDDALEASAEVGFTAGTWGTGLCGGDDCNGQ